MKQQRLGLLICFIVAASALHIEVEHDATIAPGKVNLKADTGKYLARCNGCGPGAYPDSAGVHADSGAPAYATWTIEQVGDKIAFKADTGKYLARCNGCWKGRGAYSDSAFVHVSDPNGKSYALWTPEKLANGKWAFKSDTGKYLARCNGCVSGGAKSNFAFVHSANSDGAWSQWTVEYVFPLGKVNIQADTGKYLARCNGCGPGAYPDSAGVHADSGAPAYATWTAQKIGDKIAFKADTGKYLARCNGCWKGRGAYSDSAFVHVSDPNGKSYALWTPEKLANGKWAFKSDTGKYLARCNGCVSGGAKSNFAFVHSANSDGAWSQWNVIAK